MRRRRRVDWRIGDLFSRILHATRRAEKHHYFLRFFDLEMGTTPSRKSQPKTCAGQILNGDLGSAVRGIRIPAAIWLANGATYDSVSEHIRSIPTTPFRARLPRPSSHRPSYHHLRPWFRSSSRQPSASQSRWGGCSDRRSTSSRHPWKKGSGSGA
jgi:hypothetical protein